MQTKLPPALFYGLGSGVPFPTRRPFLLAGALCSLALAACVTRPPISPAKQERPTTAMIDAPKNALPRWRASLLALNALFAEIDRALVLHESHRAPLPDLTTGVRSRMTTLADACALAPDERLVFERIHGPETPFPDHQPLRQLAMARTVLARFALAEHDLARAETLVTANLAQARATLAAQEGLIPLIHATSVWQSSLDGVEALAASPDLTPAAAHRLLTALQNDDHLAQSALAAALNGEFDFIYRVIVERMPVTDDPDLLLSAIGSLGMEPPVPLPSGEQGIGRTDILLLDVPATLAAYEADLTPYFAALKRSSRLPRDLYAGTTAHTLARYRKELGAFYDYATLDEQSTPASIAKVRSALESAPNPGGKLLACFLTPPWETLFTSTLRREAHRAAICGLLAWRIHGRPAPWSELTDLLPAPPADPFSDGPLRFALTPTPRIWSVYSNGTDDGGTLVDDNMGQPDDLVWQP